VETIIESGIIMLSFQLKDVRDIGFRCYQNRKDNEIKSKNKGGRAGTQNKSMDFFLEK